MTSKRHGDGVDNFNVDIGFSVDDIEGANVEDNENHGDTVTNGGNGGHRIPPSKMLIGNNCQSICRNSPIHRRTLRFSPNRISPLRTCGGRYEPMFTSEPNSCQATCST